ncbi:MAG: hypothetical protein H6604_09845 [Flavobacteriales bacterium]|nr:hypothetical protein [Flavobacteriales bacterium]
MSEEYLNNILDQISDFENEFIKSSERIMKAGNNKLFTLDFVALSINNRAISLIKGYLTLAKADNYLTAVSLVRLQLDNALRFFASTLVENSSDFAEHFIDGKAIRDYTDIDGKKLTDNYLAKKLENYFSGIKEVYEKTCGYIHFSDRHFFPTITREKIKDLSMQVVIGGSGNFTIEEKLDFSKTMMEVSKIVLIVVEQWKHEKIKLSEIYDGLKK